jgi:hypothetical protein
MSRFMLFGSRKGAFLFESMMRDSKTAIIPSNLSDRKVVKIYFYDSDKVKDETIHDITLPRMEDYDIFIGTDDLMLNDHN